MQESTVAKKIIGWISMIFMVLWGVFISLDYIFHHHIMVNAIKFHPYLGTMGLLAGLFLGACFLLSDFMPSMEGIKIKWVNGLVFYGLLMLFLAIIYSSYQTKMGLSGGSSISYSFFFGEVFKVQLGILLILFSSFSYGDLVISDGSNQRISVKLLKIGFGLCILSLFLFLFGALNLLISPVVLGLLILPLLLNYLSLWTFIKEMFWEKHEVGKVGYLTIFAVYILLIFVAMTQMGVIRPMPAGWDALKLYMNVPKLVSEYQGLIDGNSAYNWGLIMSIGFVAFDSVPVALALSCFPGIIIVFSLFSIGKRLISGQKGILLGALFYTLPLIVFQSSQDMKIDLALLFINLVLLEVLFIGKDLKFRESINLPFLKKDISLGFLKKYEDYHWLIIAGILAGYGFGIKYTAFFIIFAFIGFLLHKNIGVFGLIGGFLLTVGLALTLKLYSFTGVEFARSDSLIAALIFSVFGVASLVYPIIKMGINIRKPIIEILVFGIFAGLMFIPWGIKNLSTHGFSISMDHILTAKSPRPVLDLSPRPNTSSLTPYKTVWDIPSTNKELVGQVGTTPPPKNNKDTSGPKAVSPPKAKKSNWDPSKIKNSAKREEVTRFFGYENGPLRYLSLPYDLTMATNMQGMFTNIGMILMGLLPLFMFGFGNSIWLNLLKILGLFFSVGISFSSVFSMERCVSIVEDVSTSNYIGAKQSMGPLNSIYEAGLVFFAQFGISFRGLSDWLGGVPDLWTFIIIVGFIILFFLSFWHYKNSVDKNFKYLAGFSFIYGGLWFLFGAGIPWYGFLLLAIGPLAILRFIEADESSEVFSKGRRYLTYFLMTCWLILALFCRFTNGTPINENSAHVFENQVFARYKSGKNDYRKTLSAVNNAFYPSIKEINANPGKKVYCIGSFLPYFLDYNDRRIFFDDQLDYFSNFQSRFTDRSSFFKKLKDSGFNYIVFDLNTYTLDRTPEQSLKKKYDELVKLLYRNKAVSLIATDRFIGLPNGTRYINSKNGKIKGEYFWIGKEIVKRGSVAVFRIN